MAEAAQSVLAYWSRSFATCGSGIFTVKTSKFVNVHTLTLLQLFSHWRYFTLPKHSLQLALCGSGVYYSYLAMGIYIKYNYFKLL